MRRITAALACALISPLAAASGAALPGMRGDAYGWVAVAAIATVLIVGLEYAHRRPRVRNRIARGDRSLRLLILAVVVLFVGGVIANLFFSLRNTHQTLLAEARDDTANLALAVQQQLAGLIDDVDFSMSIVARSAPAQASPGTAEAAVADEMLTGAASHLPAVQAMWVIDAGGRIAHRSRDMPHRAELATQGHLQLHRQRDTDTLAFGRPMPDGRGRWFIPVSRRIERPDRRFAGMVVAALRPDYIARQTSALDLGREGVAVLMSIDGVVMQQAPLPPAMVGRPIEPTPRFIALARRSDTGSYRTAHPFDGIDRIISYRRLPGRPLVVLAGVGVNEVLAPWRQTAATYIAGSLLLLVLLTLLGVRLWRELQRRAEQQALIARLERTRRLQGGISSLIVRATTRSELFEGTCDAAVRHGRLGAAWIDMVDPATGTLSTVASAGKDAGQLLAEPVTLNDDGSGMAVETFVSGHTVVSNDLTTRTDRSPRRQCAVALGYRSKITLPLLRRNEPVATLTLLARPTGFFTADETRTLEHLAADLSHALDHLAAVERVNYLALHDALTGLPNHTLFIDRTGQRLRRAAEGDLRCAVAKIDIERFRQINATAGREAGDMVIRLIAQRLATALGRDAVLSRPERDHFMFLIDEAGSEAEIASAVQKALQACSDVPMNVDGQALHISVRAGVSLYPDDGRDTETLVRNAEAALARAKHMRERMVFYAPAMNARVAETLVIENKLRSALERGQFVLHYQPKFEARSGALCGLEALIRWKDPDEDDLILPARFVPLLEETGLILPVGEWVMNEALRDYRRWREAGLSPPRIAVNVSALQLRQDSFTRSVRSAVGGDDHAERGLELEITESMLMTRVESNADKLDAIRDMGVSIAIDDFGTGYSSLQYIARLPLDTLKIDRSFVSGMTRNTTDREIVASVISLAHQLRLKVVAEGVESNEQARLLRRLACDEVQGFLFSPPLPPGRVEALMRSSGRWDQPAALH
ncbi:EAL domain-containing protein [Lysobacter korlensis]|uniref:EAL domain-containing protein n=1 Tax=Lysobacter korlensis TaxID=553636 RepID=A0ABV6RJC8_9GAMM